MRDISIGLIGAGTVGGGVVKVLNKRIKAIREDLALPIKLARISVLQTLKIS
jgi:homoserine dehydrogenase